MSDLRPTLRAGSLAYYDTYSGMVPCKVLSIIATAEPGYTIRFRLTGTRQAYKRGEVLEAHQRYVIPRDAYKARRLGGRITYYQVQP